MTIQDDLGAQDQRTGEAALIAIDLRHVTIEGDDVLAARDVEQAGCREPLRAILLGASNTWFPVTLSAFAMTR